MERTHVPSSGKHTEKQIPAKVQRKTLMRTPHKRRICQDNRNYVEVPFTIPGPVQAIDYGPMWRADRDYWIARITMEAGLHSDAHPNDGTPGGQSIIGNMRLVKGDLSTDTGILVSDARLRIGPNNHQDAVNDEEDGKYDVGDFASHRLAEGEHIYPRVSQVGSSRPGTGVVFTMVLVPIP